MNKASALSLVSNAILYWNTSRISNIVEGLRENGEVIDDDVLAHISLLPYKHVLPNGTYFVDGEPYGTEPTERAKTVSFCLNAPAGPSGQIIDHQAVQAWADSLSTDNPLPVPR